ncbi:MAG: hypothetical protein ACLQO1_22255 [Steroidobacteraceae bacterium]
MIHINSNWLGGLSFLVFCAMHPPSLAAAAGAPDETGLYLYLVHSSLPNFEAGYSSALEKDFIDGAAVMVQWGQIEPQPDVYDWSSLDKWVVKTVQLHKKLSIGVIGGFWTPQWLYGSGFEVPKNSFDYSRSSVGVSCTVMTQPSFWHPVYLREYRKMIARLAQHLHEMQGPNFPPGAAYQALSIVKLSGINNTTEELRVDDTKPDNGPCHQSDAAAIWAKAGFTPDKVVSAFMTIAADTNHAFPDKILSVAVIHRDAFPPIDNSGQIYTTIPVPDALTSRILETAVPVYRDRLLVQWNALWQGGPPTEVAAAGNKGARIGWQMNGFKGEWEGSGCIYPPWKIEACRNAADFRSILDNGINLRGRYIEVQLGSVINKDWEPAFRAAHDRLQTEAGNDVEKKIGLAITKSSNGSCMRAVDSCWPI